MLRKFKTYGSISRRERERSNRERKAEVRHARLEVIYSREPAPVAARIEHQQ